MRGHLRTSPKIAVKLEGSLYHRPNGNNNSGQGTGSGSQQQTSSSASTANILHPACVLNGSFISQTFQILYRNEDVCLSDMAQFRLHVLVDSHKVRLLLYPPPLLSRSTHLISARLCYWFFFLPSLLSFFRDSSSLSVSWLSSPASKLPLFFSVVVPCSFFFLFFESNIFCWLG